MEFVCLGVFKEQDRGLCFVDQRVEMKVVQQGLGLRKEVGGSRSVKSCLSKIKEWICLLTKNECGWEKEEEGGFWREDEAEVAQVER